jgi:hypothetical protein
VLGHIYGPYKKMRGHYGQLRGTPTVQHSNSDLVCFLVLSKNHKPVIDS